MFSLGESFHQQQALVNCSLYVLWLTRVLSIVLGSADYYESKCNYKLGQSCSGNTWIILSYTVVTKDSTTSLLHPWDLIYHDYMYINNILNVCCTMHCEY